MATPPVFMPGLWADAIIAEMTKVTGISQQMMGAGMKHWPEKTDALEAIFVAFALEDGTSPCPTYGVDRDRLLRRVRHAFVMSPLGFQAVQLLVKQHVELFPGHPSPEPSTLFAKLASEYLDWLYSQPESQALAKEEQERLANEKVYKSTDWQI